MKSIWKWLDGNKTVICSVIFAFVSQFGADIGLSQLAIEIILWAAGGLGGVSLAHHAAKGKFSTKSN